MKRTIYLFLALVILAQILQKIERHQEFSREKTEENHTLLWIATEPRSSCYVSTPNYYFFLTGCELLEIGSAYQIVGTLHQDSDTHFFAQKRLAVSQIEPYSLSLNSPNDWLWLLRQRAVRVRRSITRLLERSLEEPSASFVTALLFGGSWRLPETTRLLFETTGILHVTAASGFHLAMVVGVLLPLRSKLSIRLFASVSCGVALLYVLLAGESPSLLRAGGLFLLMTLGNLVFLRQVSSLRLLCWCVGLLLVVRPQLATAIGFQLSVAATLGIICTNPILSHVAVAHTHGVGALATHTERPLLAEIGQYLRETILISIAAQLAATPVLLFHFGKISLLSIPASVAVLWLLPVIFMSVGVSLVIAVLAPSLLVYVAAFVHGPVVTLLSILQLFNYPGIEWEHSLSGWVAFVWITLLLVLSKYFRRSRQKSWQRLQLCGSG